MIKKRICIIISVFIFALNLYSQENVPQYPPENPEFISPNDIKPGMEGVGYSVFKGTNIEPFRVRVLSVSKYSVKTRILVEFLDDHLKKSGIVQGMSGSPIYFDGKLAGALAFGWLYNKNPTGEITPIEYMYELYNDSYYTNTNNNVSFSYNNLNLNTSHKTPLFVSGISQSAIDEYSEKFESIGFQILSADNSLESFSSTNDKFLFGDSMFMPFSDGDFSAGAIGTVTHTDNDKFLIFGHEAGDSLGRFVVPVSRSSIAYIFPSYKASFKNPSSPSSNYIGYTLYNSPYGVSGKYGELPDNVMIPIKLNINYSNFPKKEYNFRILNNAYIFPNIINMNIYNFANELSFDGIFTINYEIETDYFKDVIKISDKVFNLSGRSLANSINKFLSPIFTLLNNKTDNITIKSIKISMNHKDLQYGSMADLLVMENKISAGDTIHLKLGVVPYSKQKEYIDIPLKIPNNLKSGTYTIYIGNEYGYEDVENQLFPNKYSEGSLDYIYKIMNSDYSYDTLKIWFYPSQNKQQDENSSYPLLPYSRYSITAVNMDSDAYSPPVIKNYELNYDIIGLKKIDIKIEESRK